MLESVVEHAALAWLESLGYAMLRGPAIAAGARGRAERPELPTSRTASPAPSHPTWSLSRSSGVCKTRAT